MKRNETSRKQYGRRKKRSCLAERHTAPKSQDSIQAIKYLFRNDMEAAAQIISNKKPAHGISTFGSNLWKDAETPFRISNGINDLDHVSAPQTPSRGNYFLSVEILDCPMTEAGEEFPNETSDNQAICASGALDVIPEHAPEMRRENSSLYISQIIPLSLLTIRKQADFILRWESLLRILMLYVPGRFPV